MKIPLGSLLTVFLLCSCWTQKKAKPAYLSDDPLSLAAAKIGETQFICEASFSQFTDLENRPLKIKTLKKKTLLTEENKLLLLSNDFISKKDDTTKNIADSINISNIRLIAFFAEESSLECGDDQAELQVTTTTVFTNLDRNISVSSGFCWHKKARQINLFQNVYPGPLIKDVGIPQTGVDDFDFAGFEDKDATSVKYTLKCERQE